MNNKTPANKPITNWWIIGGIIFILLGTLFIFVEDLPTVLGIFEIVSGSILILCLGIPRLEEAKKIYEQYKDDRQAYGQAIQQANKEREEREKLAIEKAKEEREARKMRNANDVLVCPKCGSKNIAVGQRGYNLIWGFTGSNRTMNRCGSCGHKWIPRK